MNPDHAAHVTLQPLDRFDLDAAILFADILLIPIALGQTLKFAEGEGPLLSPLDDLDLDRSSLEGRIDETLTPIFETVSQVKERLDPEKALIGFAGAPWTVATYMIRGRGGENHNDIRRWAYENPDAFKDLLDALTDATIIYLRRQLERGADAVQIFDSWAGGLPEQVFKDWCVGPICKIASAIKKEFPEAPVTAFPRAVGALYEDFVGQEAIDGVSLDVGAPLAWARDHIQKHMLVQGNLDPILLLTGGDPLRRAVTDILDHLAQGPFVFNLGHGILPETPPENVAALIAMVKGN
jgi:uroporphyrinogen decarboxylase